MEILVWLLPGALIGWTASFLMRRETAFDVVFNTVLGIAGAAVGTWLLGPLLDVPAASAGLQAGVQMALLGAILSLAAVNLFAPVQALRRNVGNLRTARAGSHQHAARG